MSTRRPNVPRANRSARPAGQAGGSGADDRAAGSSDDATEGSVGRPHTSVSTDDGVISAEVLHPDFGSRDQAAHPSGSTRQASNRSGSSRQVEKTGGKAATKAGSNKPARNKKEQSKPAGGASQGAASTNPASQGAASGSAAGSKAKRKNRLSASARRASERDSARYAVRQPVVSWTRPGDAGDAAGRSEGSAAGEPVPAKAFSGRLLALAVVLIAMIVILAPTVQTYVEQRMEINALQQDIAAQQDERQRLQTQLDRWEDPAYIKQQARERLFLVMPGETRYLVVGAGEAIEPEQIPASPTGDEDVPWVDALFESIKRSATD